jgi:probable phosphoglycerate mutase
MAKELAQVLDVEPVTSAQWSGEAPGEGADDRVLTAYRSLAAQGGTVVAVTSRRGVLSVLADVLATPVERFWAIATAPGSLTAVEVWDDGSASVAFTNRTDHLA